MNPHYQEWPSLGRVKSGRAVNNTADISLATPILTVNLQNRRWWFQRPELSSAVGMPPPNGEWGVRLRRSVEKVESHLKETKRIAACLFDTDSTHSR